MKIRLIALLAVVALSVMAVPASADQGVGVFQGTAKVTPLGLPVVHGNLETGTWELDATVIAGSATGTLEASGQLGPVAGAAGAACGISNGHSGTGTFGADSLSNLGWASSAGGLLPVTGTWTHGAASGDIVALVYATGGDKCVTNNAETFTVVGVAALV